MATQPTGVPQDDPEQIVTPAEPATVEPAQGDDPADPQGPAKQAEQVQEKKRPGGWIRKLTRAEQERDYWRDVALRAQPQAQQPTQAQPDDPKPVKESFTDYEDYLAALARWNTRQEYKTVSAKAKEEQTKAEQASQEQEVIESYRERMADFADEHDDFFKVVDRIRVTPAIASTVQLAIMEDENGPALAYYLGQHPEMVENLNTMTMGGAARYIGRLAERLFPEVADEPEVEQEEASEEPAPKPKAIQAPAPIKPVKKPVPTATGLRDDEDINKWMAKRNKEAR